MLGKPYKPCSVYQREQVYNWKSFSCYTPSTFSERDIATQIPLKEFSVMDR